MIIQQTFDIPTLADAIADIVSEDPGQSKKELLVKIVALMQRTIDQKLVPRNYNAYVSKKKREKWMKEIDKQNAERKFWTDIVRKLDGNNMQVYYDEINKILKEQGFKHSPKPGTWITCFYCEREIDAANFGGTIGVYSTKDHVHPKSKGGKDNHKNLVNACNECNFLKADMLIPQFILFLQHMQINNIVHPTIPFERYAVIIKNAQKLLPVK